MIISTEAHLINALAEVVRLAPINDEGTLLKSQYKVVQGAAGPANIEKKNVSIIVDGATAQLDQGRVGATSGYALKGSEIWTLTIDLLMPVRRTKNEDEDNPSKGLSEHPIEGKDSIVPWVEEFIQQDWRSIEALSEETLNFLKCHEIDVILSGVSWVDTSSDNWSLVSHQYDLLYRRP